MPPPFPVAVAAAVAAAAASAVAAEWSLSVVGWLSHAGGASFFAAMRVCAGSLLGSLLLPRLFVLVMPMLLLQLRLEKKLLQYMDLINSPGGYLDVVLKRKFARGSDQRLL